MVNTIPDFLWKTSHLINRRSLWLLRQLRNAIRMGIFIRESKSDTDRSMINATRWPSVAAYNTSICLVLNRTLADPIQTANNSTRYFHTLFSFITCFASLSTRAEPHTRLFYRLFCNHDERRQSQWEWRYMWVAKIGLYQRELTAEVPLFPCRWHKEIERDIHHLCRSCEMILKIAQVTYFLSRIQLK